jgi:hypothetical protein
MSNAPAPNSLSQYSGSQKSAFGEIAEYLLENKKWWMLPILFVLVVFGALMLLGGTAAAPFIYTLF